MASMNIDHDRSRRCFSADMDGQVASLYYELRDAATLDILSTFVPPELRGSGIGARLVEAAAEHAGSEGLGVATTCWYAAKVLA